MAEGDGEPRPRTRGRPRLAGGDDRILAVARRLFAERGVAATTIADIAEAAQVSKPTVYLRWPSKDALVAAVIRQEFPADPVDLPRTGSAREDLEALVRGGLAPTATGTGPPAWLLSPSVAPVLAQVRTEAQESALARIREIVSAGVTDGELAATVDPDLLAEVLAGVITRYNAAPRVPPPGIGAFRGDDPAHVARRVVTLLWDGIRARS
jgi:AcrR family transcriptional regulator